VEQVPIYPKVSIIIVNTNELHHLTNCLPSIKNQTYPNYEVLIVDNVSNDGSVEYIQEEYPEFKLIRNSQNIGYAGANNAGFSCAGGKIIAVLNPDTRVDPGWLDGLVKVLHAYPKAGLVTPKILLFDDPDHINTCGNQITLSGLTFCRGLDEPSSHFPKIEKISAVSGAAFAIKRSVLDDIGGFDERFFIYYEETDLSIRALLAGYEIYYVPESVVYHKYNFRFSPKKAFYQERNRYFSLLKSLRWRTLIFLTPSFLIAEFTAWGYAIIRGPEHIYSKLRSYIWLLCHIKQILLARNEIRSIRRVNDRDLLDLFGEQFNFTRTTRPSVAAILAYTVNPLLKILGNFSRVLIKW
jgi:hypothetical protein